VLLAFEVRHYRPDERPVPAVVRVQLHRDVDLRDGGGGVGDPVDRVLVRQRPDDRDVVHDAGGVREQLAHVAPGEGGPDRPEFPADLLRGVRLLVGQLDLAGRPVQEQEDARLRPAEVPVVPGGGEVRGGRRPAAEDVGQVQPKCPETAGEQEVAAGGPVAESLAATEDAEHDILREAGGSRPRGGGAAGRCIHHAPAGGPGQAK
jgi:hypothetical protein